MLQLPFLVIFLYGEICYSIPYLKANNYISYWLFPYYSIFSDTSGEDVHTPLKIVPSVPKTKDSTSLSHVHDFKNRIARRCGLFDGDSPLVGTPVSYISCMYVVIYLA